MTYDDWRAGFVLHECSRCGRRFYIDPKAVTIFVCRACWIVERRP